MALVAGSLVVLLAFTGVHAIFIAQNYLPADIYAAFYPVLKSSTWRLCTVGAMYIGVVTMAAMFISHRMVGPAHRLADQIRRQTDAGHKGEMLKVRDGDELEDLVQAINMYIENSNGVHKK